MLLVFYPGIAAAVIACALTAIQPSPAVAEDPVSAAGRRLVAAYPAVLDRIDGHDLVWRNGTRLPLGDLQPHKPFDQWLAAPGIADMLRFDYPPGRRGLAPPRAYDPGRARNASFFDKMYGNCRTGDVARHLVDVVWLPRKARQRLKVTSINGVADKLAAVSRALDELPASFDAFLIPAAGTYNCRAIAGTERGSAHGYAIAIDIAVGKTDYWRWQKPAADGSFAYRNQIPWEIVEIFEAHGFIWGGKWHHYDTMHFEYRPELLNNPRL